jgi:hypothetical protein
MSTEFIRRKFCLLLAIRYSPIAAVLTEVGGCDNEACYLGCALRVED